MKHFKYFLNILIKLVKNTYKTLPETYFMKIIDYIKNFLIFNPSIEKESFELKNNDSNIVYDIRDTKTPSNSLNVSKDIQENISIIKNRFSVPKNNDVIIRKFLLPGNISAFLLFYDGMTDSALIDSSIIKPLLELPLFSGEENYNEEDIYQRLIIHCQIKKCKEIDAVIDDVNFGNCGVFIDGIACAFSADVKNWPHRTVQKSENEQSIYGPQEAFADMLRGNSAQVRKYLKTEKLICEKMQAGNVSKTPGVIMYIDDVVNKDLLAEVKYRTSSLSIDYVLSVEELAMMIEDSPMMITGHILATERPDRVARALSEGRIAIILNGSPRALILPTNAYELTHAAADAYLRADFANVSRFIRLISIFISVLLPGLFIAITLFHEEMLPTYLLYAISASRQNVPFPSIIELLLMELAFEMIREAGVRMPGPLGSILGIVGGLILGQAAVSAKIVSPIMIIVVAITGIGSFATADYSLGWSYRILKIIFILLGGSFGFFGIAMGIFIYSVLIASTKSFGIPFLSPLPGNNLYKKAVFVPPVWKTEKRPGYLKPKTPYKEDKISKKWRVRR